MELALKNLNVYRDGAFHKADIIVTDETVTGIAPELSVSSDAIVFDFNNAYAFPGLADVHVHLRDPGFSYKETMRTGTLAAAHGGYTQLCAMPNLDPVPDCPESLSAVQAVIDRDAVVEVHPYAAITVGENGGELTDMAALAPGAVAFSDDGRGVQDEGMMLAAMTAAKRAGRVIAAHCEDNSLLHGGCIHDGEYARLHGLPGICSESEWGPIARDLRLAQRTGCAYHVCHISCKESVELIRQAKRRGVDVTCETAPHYLLLNDMELCDEGRFRMNPPIRSEEDRLALIEGLRDGTVDMIATDHAPHSAQEKARGLRGSANGIVGLESAFSVLYTGLVRPGIISLERLIELMHDAPCRRFGIGGALDAGSVASLTVFDLNAEYEIKSESFLSMGKSCPFDGQNVFARCLMTLYRGNIVWKDRSLEN